MTQMPPCHRNTAQSIILNRLILVIIFALEILYSVKLWEESVKHSEVLRSQLKDVKTELESVQSQLETIAIQVRLQTLI